MIKSCFLILTLLSVSFTTQARDSLAALRNDLNAAVTKLQDQQDQITALQTQVDSLTPDIYAIGDTGPAGGIVFYITDAGAHGLEAAPEDQGVAQWGCFGQSITGADGTAIGTGAQNTADILAGCTEAGIAAQLATDYAWPNGQTDGYLPSKDELNVLYQQRAVVGGFALYYYWSSSESASSSAWYQYFLSGNQANAMKYNTLRVRAVRAF
ncbi:hypothetical protein [Methylotuvimicrobium sp.]|uniref:hypothetical protein n=1 Tax=Methylotuvimicrobium sp. TaxID=2822413 RepID=UPI003D648E1B